MSSFDSELWLYFEKQTKINGIPVRLLLNEMKADSAYEESSKYIYKTHLHCGFPDVTPWSPKENINPDSDQLIAVSVRLSHKTKDFFRQPIKWTLSFDVGIADKVQPITSTFCTSRCSEEGFSAAEINQDGVHVFPKFCRYLIIWDVLALAAPSFQNGKKPKTWLNDPKPTTPLLIGHRGMGAYAHDENPSQHPGDNTVAGFNEAHAIGADGVELDVQLSLDDALVIRHDFVFSSGENQNYIRDVNAMKIIEDDPDTPLLSKVFNEVDPGLGIDVEVKYPMCVMNGLLENGEEEMVQMDTKGEKILRWPKNKLADLVLKAVGPEAQKRRLFLSTFHPDLALILSRKISPSLRPLLPVLGLTRGEAYSDVSPDKLHLDLRSRTVASAASWARAVALDGIVPFAASALALNDPQQLFGKDLVVFLWGWGLNSVEVLRKMQQETWVCGLIFDKINELLHQVKSSSSNTSESN